MKNLNRILKRILCYLTFLNSISLQYFEETSDIFVLKAIFPSCMFRKVIKKGETDEIITSDHMTSMQCDDVHNPKCVIKNSEAVHTNMIKYAAR